MVDQLHDALIFVGRSRALPDESHCHDALDYIALVLHTQQPDLRVLDVSLQDLRVRLVPQVLEHDVSELVHPRTAR
eukprot:1348955-Heterocapsa_arctica.AAC.1